MRGVEYEYSSPWPNAYIPSALEHGKEGCGGDRWSPEGRPVAIEFDVDMVRMVQVRVANRTARSHYLWFFAEPLSVIIDYTLNQVFEAVGDAPVEEPFTRTLLRTVPG